MRFQMVDSYIPKIRELTQLLPSNPGTLIYDIEGRDTSVYGLLKTPQVGVVNCKFDAGTEFPRHNHDAPETVLVYEGEMELEVHGKVTVLRSGDVFTIPARAAHTVRAITETWVIAITIPADRNYPDD